jgi:hypothetical protein
MRRGPQRSEDTRRRPSAARPLDPIEPDSAAVQQPSTRALSSGRAPNGDPDKISAGRSGCRGASEAGEQDLDDLLDEDRGDLVHRGQRRVAQQRHREVVHTDYGDVTVVDTRDWNIPLQTYPVFGGQGTFNVNSWAPDGRRFAFVTYPTV